MTQLEKTLRDVLSRIPGLKLAILFGSRASGSAGPESDVDLAVLLEEPLSAQRKEYIIEAVSLELGCPVDVVDLFEAPEPILGEVLKGRRLLGEDEVYARLLTRHVINVADFLPLRERLLDERRAAWIK
ncbi:MAG: nucleotidyltransferase domain-containing protein [Gammaproteobacteria bacterium]|jgi:predicted nucleotidyltransferase|nr:nucleotidyltransferase domain-containing protein [Gammaproteobacteria bacterium]